MYIYHYIYITIYISLYRSDWRRYTNKTKAGDTAGLADIFERVLPTIPPNCADSGKICLGFRV